MARKTDILSILGEGERVKRKMDGDKTRENERKSAAVLGDENDIITQYGQ